MKSFYIVLLITITWTSSLPVQGQDSINIGTRHSLFSNILNEERMYWIYKPENNRVKKKRLPGSLLIGWRCIFPFRSRFYPFLCFFKGFFITPLCCSRCFEYRPYQRFHPYQFGCTTGWQYSAWRYSKRWRDEGFLSFLN